MNDPETNVIYRTIEEADYPAVIAMYEELNAFFYTVGYRMPHPDNVGQVWLDSFRRTLGRFSNVHVAELDGEAVGFMLCRLKRLPAYVGGVLVGELSDMFVAPKARRLGAGEKLSRLAINWMREQGVHSIEVQMLRENEAIWRIYERMGFQIEYRTARLYWPDYDD